MSVMSTPRRKAKEGLMTVGRFGRRIQERRRREGKGEPRSQERVSLHQNNSDNNKKEHYERVGISS